MSNRPSKAAIRPVALIIALMAALAVGLSMAFMPGGFLKAQAPETADSYYFYENGKDPVVTFTATDPEGVTPIYWSFRTTADAAAGVEAGDFEDYDLFSIEGGVLTFKASPSFETRADEGANGIYNVVVQASDGGRTTWVQYFKATITVLDVEEDGKVGWTVDPDGTEGAEVVGQMLRQFQAGAVLTATLNDPDRATGTSDDESITTATWKWYRASSDSGPWSEIFLVDGDGNPDTDAVYTASDTSTDNDVGMYLRAVASYTDRRGANKSAEYVSLFTVQQFRQDNTLPEFAPAVVTREVSEGPAGMVVGAPVIATDNDGDELNYMLAGTPEQVGGVDAFRVDQATGQISTAVALDFEAGDTSFTLFVRATDSAGGNTAGTADDEVPDDSTVTITLLDVNEKPNFAPEDRDAATPANVTGMLNDYPEDGGADAAANTPANLTLSIYMATDPEGGSVTLSLSGSDASKFKLTGIVSGTRTLEFAELPDFEMPGDSNQDNVYELTVVASDEVNTSERRVTVKVTDSDEDGKIELGTQNPVIGTGITATLTDSDGEIDRVTWTWQRADQPTGQGQTCADVAADGWAPAAADPGTKNEGTTNSYTPIGEEAGEDGDDGKCLRAAATYIDRTSDDMTGSFVNTAMSVSTTPVRDIQANKAPAFTEGASTVRYVNENTATGMDIGHTIAVTDGDLPDDSHTYALSGADAGSFDFEAVPDDAQTPVNEAGVQLQTKLPLNEETKARYNLRITVTDGSGESNDNDSIDVTIMVLDQDEAPIVTGDSAHDHPENSTSTIVTLSANDPERVTPVVWSLVEDAISDVATADEVADHASFDISDRGALSFKAPGANFEAASASGTDDNYLVVVQASDGGRTTALQYFKVRVAVTNEDEDGKVTWSTGTGTSENLLQFEDETTLTATATDPDNAGGTVANNDVTWEWSRSSRSNGGWTPIADQITNVYVVGSVTGNDDRGMYLRVTATYEDDAGGSETAEFIAPHPVRAARTSNNTDPVFQPSEQVRRVDEGPAGMTVGSPVEATDADGDVLTYSHGGTNANNFEVDRATGQITTAIALDYEVVDEREQTITITATDPAGRDTAPAVTVTINVQPLDDAPDFGEVAGTSTPPVNVQGMLADYFEDGRKDGALSAAVDRMLVTYSATDPEGATVTFSLEGRDAAKFKLAGDTAGTRTLEFIELPDFEAPGDQGRNNIYEATVVASDGSNTAKRSITVKVLDSDEDGKITIGHQNPVIGTAITATLVDSDGDIDRVTWTWQKAPAPTTQGDTCADDVEEDEWMPGVVIPGAKDEGTNNSYTPTADDNNMCLRAAASYMDRTATEADVVDDTDPADEADGIEFLNTAVSVSTTPVRDAPENEAPKFPEGQGTVRYVNEDAELNTAVGHAVMAMDADDDELKYTLSGTDAASFAIDDALMGQLSTKAKLNYEAKAEYRVIVTATDNAQTGPKSASIEVTISVMDVDEKPTILSGAVAITGSTRHSVPEGTTDVGTYAVSGGDDQTVSWRLTGTDAGDFSISSSGVVTFRSTPNYESPADSGRDNNYVFTVTATVGGDPQTRDVTVNVTNVDEPGEVTISPRTLIAVDTGLTATLTDPDGGITNRSWQWVRETTGGGSVNIGTNSNTYTVVADDAEAYLVAKVRYTDAQGSGKDAESTRTDAVAAPSAPQTVLERYDTNGDGSIDRPEASVAILQFSRGQVSRAIASEVFALYSGIV